MENSDRHSDMVVPAGSLTWDRLFDFHKLTSESMRDELEFCFNYLNFFVGLLSALLAATITGILQLPVTDRRGLLILIGPALVVVLAVLGYRTVKVFYRRYVEAWVTILNIDEMLGFKAAPDLAPGLRPPTFRSKFHEGFIAEFERPQIRSLLDRAKKENWRAEELLVRTVAEGDTLRYAWWTFALFVAAAIVTAGVTLFVVL